MPIALAVHGGAWNIPDDAVAAHAGGVTEALRTSWEALRAGAAAIDVVEIAVRCLENDPTFNAGYGAHLNRDCRVELDASIMDGRTLRAGAVAAVRGIRNPVEAARRVMDSSPHVLLVGAGARRFAKEHRVRLCGTRALLVGRERDVYDRIRSGDRRPIDFEFREEDGPPHGTVGAVAIDASGSCAAATSTGGTQDKAAGRVGDTPVPGAGTYADDRAGAASCTGWGESILRVVMAKEAVDRMRRGAPAGRAASGAVRALGRIDGLGGLVVVDHRGRAAAAFNTPRMARGIATEKAGLRVFVDRRVRP